MKLYIKNMVCNRCIHVVKEVLQKSGVQQINIRLGEVELKEEPTAEQIKDIHDGLKSHGFELLDDQRKKVIEKIKNTIVARIQEMDDENTDNFSDILSRELHKDYSSISKLFSEVEGITIEKFIINQKIEKVKELLIYDEWSLSEIAFKLGYSSVAHLSAQFKKVTGFNPSAFKKLQDHHRKPLDKI